jgi:hypothetical protein
MPSKLSKVHHFLMHQISLGNPPATLYLPFRFSKSWPISPHIINLGVLALPMRTTTCSSHGFKVQTVFWNNSKRSLYRQVLFGVHIPNSNQPGEQGRSDRVGMSIPSAYSVPSSVHGSGPSISRLLPTYPSVDHSPDVLRRKKVITLAPWELSPAILNPRHLVTEQLTPSTIPRGNRGSMGSLTLMTPRADVAALMMYFRPWVPIGPSRDTDPTDQKTQTTMLDALGLLQRLLFFGTLANFFNIAGLRITPEYYVMIIHGQRVINDGTLATPMLLLGMCRPSAWNLGPPGGHSQSSRPVIRNERHSMDP